MAGEIRRELAYAQGKMIDHSGLGNHLPRGITPSDIDMVLDNAGQIMFVEVSTRTCDWSALPTGQRRLYESLVKNSPRQRAVLCHVSSEPGKQIDTHKDVLSFSVMSFDGVIQVSPPVPGERWVDYLRKFYGLPVVRIPRETQPEG